MSQFQSMYLIPKQLITSLTQNGDAKTKNALSSGIIRQLNSLDVNEGGRVIIRNDDHYKNVPAVVGQKSTKVQEAQEVHVADGRLEKGAKLFRPSQHRINEVNKYHGIRAKQVVPNKASNVAEGMLTGNNDLFSEEVLDEITEEESGIHKLSPSYHSTPIRIGNTISEESKNSNNTSQSVDSVRGALGDLQLAGIISPEQANKYLINLRDKIEEHDTTEPISNLTSYMDTQDPTPRFDRTVLVTTPLDVDKIITPSPHNRASKMARAEEALNIMQSEGIINDEVGKKFLEEFDAKLPAKTIISPKRAKNSPKLTEKLQAHPESAQKSARWDPLHKKGEKRKRTVRGDLFQPSQKAVTFKEKSPREKRKRISISPSKKIWGHRSYEEIEGSKNEGDYLATPDAAKIAQLSSSASYISPLRKSKQPVSWMQSPSIADSSLGILDPNIIDDPIEDMEVLPPATKTKQLRSWLNLEKPTRQMPKRKVKVRKFLGESP